VIREQVCRDAAWLGVVLDPAANQAGGPRISASASKVPVWGDTHQRRADDRAPYVGDRGGAAMKTVAPVSRSPNVAADNARSLLKGSKVLVCGIANEHSIAYGCAKAFHELGANLAITYLNEKSKGYVEPIARQLEAPIFMPLDVSKPGELEAVFARIGKEWGKLDTLVHSIAWAPKDDLQGGLLSCSAEGFARRWTYPAIPSYGWPAWRRL
jgi:hypothetical protein